MEASKGICLVCADSVDPYAAVSSMMRSISAMPMEFFSSAVLFTDLIREKTIKTGKVPISVCSVPKISSVKEYSKFIMKKMPTLALMNVWRGLPLSHYLVVQSDSWVVNPDSWTDAFLQYDYVGAPLCCHPRDVVMNGGFSLRSRKLCEFVESSGLVTELDDDTSICRTYRRLLEDSGFVFAQPVVSSKFAVEGRPVVNQFGQHACGDGVYLGFDRGTPTFPGTRRVFVCPPGKVFPCPTPAEPDAYAYTLKNPEDALKIVDYEYTQWHYRELGIVPPPHPKLVWERLKYS